jgi:hypothetical protein
MHFVEPANYISHYSDYGEATSTSPLQSLLRSSSYSYLHYTESKIYDARKKSTAIKQADYNNYKYAQAFFLRGGGLTEGEVFKELAAYKKQANFI